MSTSCVERSFSSLEKLKGKRRDLHPAMLFRELKLNKEALSHNESQLISMAMKVLCLEDSVLTVLGWSKALVSLWQIKFDCPSMSKFWQEHLVVDCPW